MGASCSLFYSFKMVTRTTNVDKIEFALMKADLSSLRTDVHEVKNTLKEFVNSADERYMTRKEAELKFDAISARVTDNKTNTQRVLDWTAKWGPVIALVAFLLLGKVII